MNYRKSFKTFALSAAVAGAMMSSAYAQEVVELKVSHFVPPNHTFHKAMVAWGEELGKLSGGRLKLTIYPAGQLGGGPNRQFDAARNGITDIAISLHGATPGRYATTVAPGLPSRPTTAEPGMPGAKSCSRACRKGSRPITWT